MRKISLPNLVAIMIVMTFLLLSNTKAFGKSTLWKNRLNGSGDNADRYNGAVKDAAGNFYLTGYTVSPGTGKDFLTVKLNSAGDTVWTRKYNYVANFDDEANFIVIDALGNITVSGYSDGGSTSTKNDILTIQYSAAGALLWATRYNNAAVNEYEFPAGLCVDAANNIFISGRTDNDAGNIDDVSVWGRALSSGEMNALYASSSSFSNGSDLEGMWKFDENLNDDTGNSNDLQFSF